MSEKNVILSNSEALDLAKRAILSVGADGASASSLASATVSAELHGRSNVGFAHLLDYLASFREGRINRSPRPVLQGDFPAIISCDADDGVAQLGFDIAFARLVETACELGVSIFKQRNSYSTGELGYYVRRLAESGLVALAVTNANAVMAASAGGPRMYGTNPMAFAFPMGEGLRPILIDQASSATALVNIIAAASEGRAIPHGLAVDEGGNDTDDPSRALAGALLPFGGRRGANIALMVELLSAGMSGGSWSIDAPTFDHGSRSPRAGLTVIAMVPGSQDVVPRVRLHADRIRGLGVYVPGTGPLGALSDGVPQIAISRSVFDAVTSIAEGNMEPLPVEGSGIGE